MNGFECDEDCPYRKLNEMGQDLLTYTTDVIIDGTTYYISCDTDHMKLDAADALENLKKFQWIPVSERTPDDYGAVLLQYKNRMWLETEKRETLGIGYFDAFGNEEPRADGCELFRGEVVAWMPLPEPYKKEE